MNGQNQKSLSQTTSVYPAKVRDCPLCLSTYTQWKKREITCKSCYSKKRARGKKSFFCLRFFAYLVSKQILLSDVSFHSLDAKVRLIISQNAINFVKKYYEPATKTKKRLLRSMSVDLFNDMYFHELEKCRNDLLKRSVL